MTDYPRIDSSDIKIGMIVERRERFEVQLLIVGINGITDEVLFSVEG